MSEIPVHGFQKLISSFFSISKCAVCSRAPLEPYYGRFIGPLTQFAHGIKVSSIYWIFECRNCIANCSLTPNLWFIFAGRRLCCRWINNIYQIVRIRRHRSRCVLLGWENTTAKSRRVHHTISRRVHWKVSSTLEMWKHFNILQYFIWFCLTMRIRGTCFGEIIIK